MSEANSGAVLSGLERDARIFGIFGVCRSGTTAMQKLLISAGVVAYHQPIKSTLSRGETVVDLSAGGRVSAEARRQIAIKEAIGSYSVLACTYDALGPIADSVPTPEQVQTIITLKDPYNNFLSWIRMTENAPPRKPVTTEQLLENFILSYKTLHGIFEESRRRGIKTTVFDYDSDSMKDNAEELAQGLLDSIGLDSTAYTEGSWASIGGVDSPETSVIHLYPRPANILHDHLDASRGLEYVPPHDGAQILSPDMQVAVMSRLIDSGVYTAHNAMLQHAVQLAD